MTEKWYKQFWPWFLIAIPFTSFMLGFVIVYLAVTTENSMVSDDYYKEGKAINVDISKKNMAKQLNLIAGIKVTDNRIVLRFKQALPPDSAAITLDFFHATLEDKDFSVLLTKNAKDFYTGELNHDIRGKWRLTLSDYADSWKIQRMVSFPQSTEISLEP